MKRNSENSQFFVELELTVRIYKQKKQKNVKTKK